MPAKIPKMLLEVALQPPCDANLAVLHCGLCKPDVDRTEF
jgi:hypothetical protein